MNYPLLQLVEVTRERIATWILDSNSNLRGSSFPISYLYLVKSCGGCFSWPKHMELTDGHPTSE